MNKPLFTIIMPVFNAAQYLDATIKSVLAQNEDDFEFIIINDGSTDDSLSILLAWAAKDDRIKLLSQDNAGVSAARNLGIDMAQGLLLAFLDSDDLWRQDKLRIHAKLHKERPEITASFARIAFMPAHTNNNKKAISHSTVPSSELIAETLLGENPICTTSNLVVRKTAFAKIGGFEQGSNFAEDQEIALRLAANGGIITGIQKTLVDYRMNETGLSSNLDAMYNGWKNLAAKYTKDSISISAAEAIYLRYLSRRALRTGGDSITAIRYAYRGLTINRAAFLADRKRGLLTLISALISPVIPQILRKKIFA